MSVTEAGQLRLGARNPGYPAAEPCEDNVFTIRGTACESAQPAAAPSGKATTL